MDKFDERASRVRQTIVNSFSMHNHMPCAYLMVKDGNVEDISLHDPDGRDHHAHCKLLRTHSKANQACIKDEQTRAQQLFESDTNTEILSRCHLGLYNYSIKLASNNSEGVLNFGQALIEDNIDLSRKIHSKRIEELDLPEDAIREIKAEFEKLPKHTPEVFENYAHPLKEIQEWFNWLEDHEREQEEKSQERIARALHELTTWQQQALNNADYLVSLIDETKEKNPSIDFKELKNEANNVINSIEKINTVMQTTGSGKFLEEYDISEIPILETSSQQGLKGIVLDALNLVSPEIEAKNLETMINFNAPQFNHRTVAISITHIDMAIRNIIQNAVKYSYSKSKNTKRFIRIYGEVPYAQIHKYIYVISIENYGIGIEADEHHRIFEDGYQGKHTDGEFRTGIGKGLSLVKEVLDAHSCHISVDSKLQGRNAYLTNFKIYFPRHDGVKINS